jgi:amidase
MFTDYWKHDALGLAALVRRGEWSAEQVVEAAIAACERLNPTLNVACHRLYDQARAAARRPLLDQAFAGVPFLLKDIGAQMEGTPYECGSRLMRGHVSRYDTNLTQRFTAAGLITIAKSTTPEFGAQITTEPLLTGVTRNPWNLDVTPGGSSGGSAAAVAAGIVPVAHANDGLGSIRIPAANCGVFGLKPTRQRTPTGPKAGEVSTGRAVEFVVSRTVRDSAALLDAVHGADVGAPYWAPPPRRPYMQELTAAPGSLRIAFTTRTFSGAQVHPACAEAVRTLVSACERMGHAVEEAAPRFDWPTYMRTIRTVAMASFAAGLESAGSAVGRVPGEDNVEPLTWLCYLEGKRLSAADYFHALDEVALLQRTIGAFFERYDVLVTPMLSQPPADIGWLGTPDGDLDVFWEKFSGDSYSPFAGVFNLTGHPAASVPTAETPDLRPIGTHIVGRFGEEGTLFRLAGQLERLLRWHERVPRIHVSNLPVSRSFAS